MTGDILHELADLTQNDSGEVFTNVTETRPQRKAARKGMARRRMSISLFKSQSHSRCRSRSGSEEDAQLALNLWEEVTVHDFRARGFQELTLDTLNGKYMYNIQTSKTWYFGVRPVPIKPKSAAPMPLPNSFPIHLLRTPNVKTAPEGAPDLLPHNEVDLNNFAAEVSQSQESGFSDNESDDTEDLYEAVKNIFTGETMDEADRIIQHEPYLLGPLPESFLSIPISRPKEEPQASQEDIAFTGATIDLTDDGDDVVITQVVRPAPESKMGKEFAKREQIQMMLDDQKRSGLSEEEFADFIHQKRAELLARRSGVSAQRNDSTLKAESSNTSIGSSPERQNGGSSNTTTASSPLRQDGDSSNTTIATSSPERQEEEETVEALTQKEGGREGEAFDAMPNMDVDVEDQSGNLNQKDVEKVEGEEFTAIATANQPSEQQDASASRLVGSSLEDSIMIDSDDEEEEDKDEARANATFDLQRRKRSSSVLVNRFRDESEAEEAQRRAQAQLQAEQLAASFQEQNDLIQQQKLMYPDPIAPDISMTVEEMESLQLTETESASEMQTIDSMQDENLLLNDEQEQLQLPLPQDHPAPSDVVIAPAEHAMPPPPLPRPTFDTPLAQQRKELINASTPIAQINQSSLPNSPSTPSFSPSLQRSIQSHSPPANTTLQVRRFRGLPQKKQKNN